MADKWNKICIYFVHYVYNFSIQGVIYWTLNPIYQIKRLMTLNSANKY